MKKELIKMLLFLLDLLVFNLTRYNTYFVLLNLSKKRYVILIIIGLILDYIIFDTYIKNTIVFLIMIFINKYIINYNLKNIVNFLGANILNYVIFFFLSSFVNFDYSLINISYIIIQDFFVYIVFSLIYYYKFIN